MKSIWALLLGATLVGCAAGTLPATTSAGSTMNRPTEPFRREHAEIKEHLSHLNDALGKLETAAPDAQRETMQQVVTFMREHIAPHAEWEEHVLYPAVDKKAKTSADAPFTASMRWEHGVVHRWTDELAKMAASPNPDPAAFVRRADNLLGLLWAHFEEEEEVLLPLLDRTMSPEEFQREIGSHLH